MGSPFPGSPGLRGRKAEADSVGMWTAFEVLRCCGRKGTRVYPDENRSTEEPRTKHKRFYKQRAELGELPTNPPAVAAVPLRPFEDEDSAAVTLLSNPDASEPLAAQIRSPKALLMLPILQNLQDRRVRTVCKLKHWLGQAVHGPTVLQVQVSDCGAVLWVETGSLESYQPDVKLSYWCACSLSINLHSRKFRRLGMGMLNRKLLHDLSSVLLISLVPSQAQGRLPGAFSACGSGPHPAPLS